MPSLTESRRRCSDRARLLVGATDWCTHPADLDVTRVRGTKNPDVAAIVALAPDLVVANQEENRRDDLDALRAAGVPVYVTDIRTLDGAVDGAFGALARMLAACGITRPRWLDDAERAWAAVPEPARRRRAVVPIWRRPWMAVGRDTFTGAVLARLGVDNALCNDPERYPRFDPEALPAARPRRPTRRALQLHRRGRPRILPRHAVGAGQRPTADVVRPEPCRGGPGAPRIAPGGLAQMASAKYDYVIVGGGSAGSAIANRLSADPATQVLVLEAGIADHRWDPIITMPAALGFPVGNRRYDWCYATEPEPHMQNRRMRQPRGKILGGSSSINGMMYHRGHPADFDQWAAETGEPGWDYAHVLPYFQRHEHVLTADPEGIRGHAGPQILEPAEARGPLFDAFFAAARQAGHRVTTSINDHIQEGVAPAERMIHNGRRLSASRAYLAPIRARANLEVRCGVQVGRVIMEGTRAVGVSFRQGSGGEERVFAGEVVLCGGTMGTPHVLQLSGIGPADVLERVGRAGGRSASPPSGRTWRTTSRCTCSTGARSRCRCWRCARSTAGPGSRRNGCSPEPARAPATTRRPPASTAATRRRTDPTS